MSTSDTPRTDAQAIDVSYDLGRGILLWKSSLGAFVDRAFCSQLERELNEANRQLAEARQTIEDVCTGAKLDPTP